MTGRGGEIFRLIEWVVEYSRHPARRGIVSHGGKQVPTHRNGPGQKGKTRLCGTGPKTFMLRGSRPHVPDPVGSVSFVVSSQQPYPVFEYHSLGVSIIC